MINDSNSVDSFHGSKTTNPQQNVDKHWIGGVKNHWGTPIMGEKVVHDKEIEGLVIQLLRAPCFGGQLMLVTLVPLALCVLQY